jgi:2-polyprenyl-3-methyl-5-hydroxy-6-metoxy-1,4-benzoquinol methylase
MAELTSPLRKRCVACHELSHAACFEATERMLGTREVFRYWECEHCGCVQIEAIPKDLGRHYPAGYFSFKPHHRLARSRIRSWIDPIRLRADLGEASVLGRAANAVMKPLNYAAWCHITGLDHRARVLDVGCGAGKMIVRMRLAGFSRCLGVDPFLTQEIHYDNGAQVLRESLIDFAARTDERFDLIMFHHSLEHFPDPDPVLSVAVTLLDEGGWVLLRVPVAGCYAWRQYRDRWYSLDAPRHLFVPSARAVDSIAARAGLRVQHTQCDSTKWSLMASELYARDICVNAPAAQREIFSADEDRAYERRSAELNEQGDGDQAAFFLNRI